MSKSIRVSVNRRPSHGSFARRWYLLSALLAALSPACGEQEPPLDPAGTGGAAPTGSVGGALTGGALAGGGSTGGLTSTGGLPTTGGSSPATGGASGGLAPTGGNGSTGGAGAGAGGTSAGGTQVGGTASGGLPTGGAATGGTATGGTPTGGTATGGTATGGAATGGAATGGVQLGGASSGGESSGGESSGGANEGGSAGSGTAGDAVPSVGCGKTPTLTSGNVTVGSRDYILNVPADYDNEHPYRMILGFHGATGRASDVAGDYFGLLPLAQGSTIFVAANAVGGLWSAATDVDYVDDILAQVTADLCIDTSRIMLEGFSQGAAMSWTIACSRPQVFRAVAGHSGGGVANPTSCEPVPYLGSLGLGESGNSQTTQTDQFARWNGCTVETLPTAPTGSHVCTDYQGCPAQAPVRWCSYDGGHTPSPVDAGQGQSWMPQEVWGFFTQF